MAKSLMAEDGVQLAIDRQGGRLDQPPVEVRLLGKGYDRMFSLPPWEPSGAKSKHLASIFELSEQLYDDARHDNIGIPAAYTYLGQFIAHDITLALSAGLREDGTSKAASNFRTPKLDLDSIYGGAPEDRPYFYEPRSNRFVIGRTRSGESDLPRTGSSPGSAFALIGDPRNDLHFIVTQLHLALLRFHNAIADAIDDWKDDRLKDDIRIAEGEKSTRAVRAKLKADLRVAFDHARRLTRWHFQWVVANDYLGRLCNKTLLSDILRNKEPSYYHPGGREPYIPIEFSLAGFRFGHSMVRAEYKLNPNFEKKAIPVFGGEQGWHKTPSLLARRPLPRGWTIEWDRLLQVNGDWSSSHTIGPYLSQPLRWLPMPTEPGDQDGRSRSLTYRTLVRGYEAKLPAGRSVARFMRLFEKAEFPVLDVDDPLWVYVLREANELEDGLKLGPVGQRIVASVLLGLLKADRDSYLARKPKWTPALADKNGNFELRDLLSYAGVCVTREDWDRHVARKRKRGAAKRRSSRRR